MLYAVGLFDIHTTPFVDWPQFRVPVGGVGGCDADGAVSRVGAVVLVRLVCLPMEVFPAALAICGGVLSHHYRPVRLLL